MAVISQYQVVISGQLITAALWNGMEQNIINNGLVPSGIEDYSATDNQMQITTDPYPASAISRPTSLQGELERLRYQILQINKTLLASQPTYWYQDPPTNGIIAVGESGANTALTVSNLTGSSDILNLKDNATTVVTVKDGGNVGIGETSPGQLLSVKTSNGSAFAASILNEIASGSPGGLVVLTGQNGNNLAFAVGQGTTIASPGYYSFRAFGDGTVQLRNGVVVDEFSSDGTLGGNSDLAVPTEKAVKTYVGNFSVSLLADNSVSTNKIVDLSVTTGKINDLAITTGKLAAGAVTDAKVTDVAASKITGTISTSQIGNSQVTTAKITDNNVTLAKLSTAIRQPKLVRFVSGTFDTNSATSYADLLNVTGYGVILGICAIKDSGSGTSSNIYLRLALDGEAAVEIAGNLTWGSGISVIQPSALTTSGSDPWWGSTLQGNNMAAYNSLYIPFQSSARLEHKSETLANGVIYHWIVQYALSS